MLRWVTGAVPGRARSGPQPASPRLTPAPGPVCRALCGRCRKDGAVVRPAAVPDISTGDDSVSSAPSPRKHSGRAGTDPRRRSHCFAKSRSCAAVSVVPVVWRVDRGGAPQSPLSAAQQDASVSPAPRTRRGKWHRRPHRASGAPPRSSAATARRAPAAPGPPAGTSENLRDQPRPRPGCPWPVGT